VHFLRSKASCTSWPSSTSRLAAENHTITPRPPNVPNVLQSATSTRRVMRAAVAQGLPVPLYPSVCMHTTYPHRPTTASWRSTARHGTALVATSGSPSPLVCYLGAYLGRLELWLRDWRITISVSKSAVVLFVRAATHLKNVTSSVSTTPKPVSRCSCLSCSDSWYTAFLVGTRHSGQKKGSSNTGPAWSPP
jgi:hypothetical protein